MKNILFISCLVFAFSCSKESGCNNTEHVILRNLTGLDGCGWVLQLDDGSKLEPQNLNDFEIEYVEGKSLHVSYTEIDGASICMVGQIVKINCLVED